MISFGIMTALLVALACVVHYDLLGLYLAHPYGRRIVYADNERYQSVPRSEFDHIWIPRPGTDPNTLYLLPRPVTVQDRGGDGEHYWTDSDDDVSRGNLTGGRLSDGEVYRWESAPDTVVDRVSYHHHDQEPNESDDGDDYVAPGQEWDDGDDYFAPGQEWDDDVF